MGGERQHSRGREGQEWGEGNTRVHISTVISVWGGNQKHLLASLPPQGVKNRIRLF